VPTSIDTKCSNQMRKDICVKIIIYLCINPPNIYSFFIKIAFLVFLALLKICIVAGLSDSINKKCSNRMIEDIFQTKSTHLCINSPKIYSFFIKIAFFSLLAVLKISIVAGLSDSINKKGSNQLIEDIP
jgi:hypothetical protein